MASARGPMTDRRRNPLYLDINSLIIRLLLTPPPDSRRYRTNFYMKCG